MPTYKTPGVYTEEISKFPPSVAEVATAIPAFIGYTEKAERHGQDLTNQPTRIKSLLEYQQWFGGEFLVTSVDVVVEPANGYSVQSVAPQKRFYMYEALRLYFDNGGGPCYIVSVGRYTASIAVGDEATGTPGFRVGLKVLEKYDEPTIIVFPDATLLGTADFYTLQQRALDQSARLMDRVAVLDLKENQALTVDFVQQFRDSIGINNLKYGAAYTPWLLSTYPKTIPFSMFRSTVKDTASSPAAVDLANLDIDPTLNALVARAGQTATDEATLKARVDALRTDTSTTYATIADRYAHVRGAVRSTNDADAPAAITALLAFVRALVIDLTAWRGAVGNAELKKDIDALVNSKGRQAATKLVALEKNNTVQSHGGAANTDTAIDTSYTALGTAGWVPSVSGVSGSATDFTLAADGTTVLPAATQVNRIAAEVDPLVADFLSFIDAARAAAATRRELAEQTLYQEHRVVRNIIDSIARELARVPPSGAVAGVYAVTDRTRGVWKAPANVSLSSVLGPTRAYDYYDQEDLNVDVNGGKSVNAIRTFTGAGTLIWGARTLAGNDNEWRYVPVRRFFNMVEESVKKSTAWAVFEPNDPNLWTKVKGMIDNYLIQKWRDGALVGATSDKAFFTSVGLGVTMTAQDVLEGRLIIEIGMAVVRPAEFIILRFSHKMQEL